MEKIINSISDDPQYQDHPISYLAILTQNILRKNLENLNPDDIVLAISGFGCLMLKSYIDSCITLEKDNIEKLFWLVFSEFADLKKDYNDQIVSQEAL